MFTGRILLVVAVALFGVGAATSPGAAAPAGAVCSHVASDFNGDGYADAAVAAPSYSPAGYPFAGAVQVLQGSAAGLPSTGGQLFDDASFPQITPSANDLFGQSLVAGDFNGDCFADLAIAITGNGRPEGDAVAPAGTAADSHGVIAILYGSASGLTTTGDQILRIDALDPNAPSEHVSLAAGDFNHDGRADLAIGDEDGGLNVSGSVAVTYGTTSGLSDTGAQLITQDTPGVPETARPGVGFGWSLAAGDFSGDGYADLAIGAPDDRYGASDVAAGSVSVLPGGPTGLSGTGSRLFTQDTAGVPGTGESGDTFGDVLAAGDITGDGRADLAIGAPGESIGTVRDAGAVTILHGAAGTLLTATGAQAFSQNTTGVPGTAETNDEFGSALTFGNFNGDKHADLAIGDRSESIGTIRGAGTVTVMYGRTAGLTTTGVQTWDQNSPGIAGTAETNDFFGFALAARPVRSSGADDLLIGDVGESTPTYTECGALALLRGGSSGLTATGNQLITPAHLTGGTQDGASSGDAIG